MNFKKEELIGEGRVSKIYLKDGYAYKKFRQNIPKEWALYEYKLHNEIVKKVNLSMVSYYDILDSSIIKMEYINGKTLAQLVRSKTISMPISLDIFVAMQLEVHQYHKDIDIENGHDVFKWKIENSNLSDTIKQKAYQSLNNVKRDTKLCHLDFHYDNVMFNEFNTHYIIDWANATLSNPAFDIARTYLLFKQYIKRQTNNYLKRVLKNSQIFKEDIEMALPAMATIRLIEVGNTSPFAEELLQLIG